MADLKLIQLAEIRDERDNHVKALEGAVGELQGWRTEVDGNIDDIRMTSAATSSLQRRSLSNHR